MRWGHVIHTEEMRSAHKILVGEQYHNRPLWKPTIAEKVLKVLK
jgi:hypothetical protein